jgi:DNA end-binding protein Ku
MFLEAPYFLGPDGPVAEEGFAVLREALRRAKRIGIGRVVLSGKEKLVALKPAGRGFVFSTLRYVSEVRQASAYFEDLKQEPPDAAQVALALKLIVSKAGPLNLASFEDRYQTALLDLIKAKVEGSAPVLAPRREVGQVISLVDSLRKSLQQSERKPDTKAGKNGHKRVVLAA